MNNKLIGKVESMTSSNGNKVANQFIITNESTRIFQSYDTIIAVKYNDGVLYLDSEKWNYSKTTSKYRNQFTRLTTDETKKAIKDGKIKLVNLN